MENLILFLATAFLFRRPELAPRKVPVSSCGRTAQLPSTPLTRTFCDDTGNPVYVGQAGEGPCLYGFATVELQTVIHDRSRAEQALFLFMEDMHDSFSIAHTTGLEHGYHHRHSSEVWGMTDYWQDSDGVDWKVKGWTDGRVMTVLYVKNIGAGVLAQTEAFLDSFQFNPTEKLEQ
jgi:hypothetical protein